MINSKEYLRLMHKGASPTQLRRKRENIMVLRGDTEVRNIPLSPIQTECFWCGGLLMSDILDCHRCGGPRMKELEELSRSILLLENIEEAQWRRALEGR